MIADFYIDEVFYDGKDIRSTAVPSPDRGCMWTEVKLNYVPGAVLAVAAHSARKAHFVGFSLEAKSDMVAEWNFSVNAGDGTKTRVFGIAASQKNDTAPACLRRWYVASTRKEDGTFNRPNDKQPPSGWTDNSFDDSSWGIPDGIKFQYSCWYELNQYTFWRVRPGISLTSGSQVVTSAPGIEGGLAADSAVAPSSTYVLQRAPGGGGDEGVELTRLNASLSDMLADLTRELELKGTTMPEKAAEACEQLGVDSSGLHLEAMIVRCHEMVMDGSP